jgi:hypothetical protein
MSDFLNDIGSGSDVNCLDMARATVCFSNAIGCALTVRVYGQIDGGGYKLNHPVNCIDPIGIPGITNSPFEGGVQNDCRSSNWAFWYHSYAYNSSYVWDATLKYDTGSDPDHVQGADCGTTYTPATVHGLFQQMFWNPPIKIIFSIMYTLHIFIMNLHCQLFQ